MFRATHSAKVPIWVLAAMTSFLGKAAHSLRPLTTLPQSATRSPISAKITKPRSRIWKTACKRPKPKPRPPKLRPIPPKPPPRMHRRTSLRHNPRRPNRRCACADFEQRIQSGYRGGAERLLRRGIARSHRRPHPRLRAGRRSARTGARIFARRIRSSTQRQYRSLLFGLDDPVLRQRRYSWRRGRLYPDDRSWRGHFAQGRAFLFRHRVSQRTPFA